MVLHSWVTQLLSVEELGLVPSKLQTGIDGYDSVYRILCLDNDDQISFPELAAWMRKAETEIPWIKNLCTEIQAFHAPK